MHFAGVINRYDFIDTVVRFADPRRFQMMACTFTEQCNVEPPDYASDNIPHFMLGVRGRRNYLHAFLRLAQILRRERVDILHTHHYDEALIGVFAAMLARTPVVIIGRHYHDEIYRLTNGTKRRVRLALERFVNHRARAIVVPSTPIRELLVQRQTIAREKVWVIPYGFDFQADRYRLATPQERHAIRQELGLEGYFVVGNFGRHHRLKGQEYLLHAFARFKQDYPDSRLLMVGDGPYHETLRELAKELGLINSLSMFSSPQSPIANRPSQSVLFTGWRKDTRHLMAAVDVVVHPTLLDSFPQVMVEAMVLGRLLITTPAAGPIDQVRHQETGLLVPMQDSDALYDTLRWTSKHPKEVQELAKRARAYVRSTLDIRGLIRRYEEVYVQVALNGGQSR